MKNVNGRNLPVVERAAYRRFPDDGSNVPGKKREGFVEGAKWQKARTDRQQREQKKRLPGGAHYYR